MRKADITTRESTRYDGEYLPSVNVKVQPWAHASKIAEHFGCSNDLADQAAQYAFDAEQEAFWENIQDTAEQYLGSGIKVYSAGPQQRLACRRGFAVRNRMGCRARGRVGAVRQGGAG